MNLIEFDEVDYCTHVWRPEKAVDFSTGRHWVGGWICRNCKYEWLKTYYQLPIIGRFPTRRLNLDR